MTKEIYTLVDDIYQLVSQGFKPSEENWKLFVEGCKEALFPAFEQGCNAQQPRIRMSMLGTPNRKIWFALKSGLQPKPLKPHLAISFMYGHILEQLLLLFARESGHKVEDCQKEVEILGIKGHIDSVIDGWLIDEKSASSFGFKKFENGTLFKDDPYGYIHQNSGYAEALKTNKMGWLAINKESGQLALLLADDMDILSASQRIKEIQDIVAQDTPPEEKCFQPVKISSTDGSGNLMLDKPCQWCDYKEACWKDANNGFGLRKFQYSSGVKYLVHIEKEPRVDEIENDDEEINEREV